MTTLPWTELHSRLLRGLLLTTVTAAEAFAQSVTVSKSTEPALPPGQVWQCTVDGQRTFSDKRCGAGASVRQINDVNRMDPTPAPPIHFYESPSLKFVSPGSPPEDGASPIDSDQIYGTPPVIVVNRHGSTPRPHPHRRSQAHK
jgi:hypothetical protein